MLIFVEIFHDFGWFFATRIRFNKADPDPADQNETDPNGSGSATLLNTYANTHLLNNLWEIPIPPMIVNTGGRFVCLFGYRVVHSDTELDISSWSRIYRTGSYQPRPQDLFREAAQKSSYFSGPATKAFTPPRLSGIRNFFPYIKKVLFP